MSGNGFCVMCMKDTNFECNKCNISFCSQKCSLDSRIYKLKSKHKQCIIAMNHNTNDDDSEDDDDMDIDDSEEISSSEDECLIERLDYIKTLTQIRKGKLYTEFYITVRLNTNFKTLGPVFNDFYKQWGVKKDLSYIHLIYQKGKSVLKLELFENYYAKFKAKFNDPDLNQYFRYLSTIILCKILKDGIKQNTWLDTDLLELNAFNLRRMYEVEPDLWKKEQYSLVRYYNQAFGVVPDLDNWKENVELGYEVAMSAKISEVISACDIYSSEIECFE